MNLSPTERAELHELWDSRTVINAREEVTEDADGVFFSKRQEQKSEDRNNMTRDEVQQFLTKLKRIATVDKSTLADLCTVGHAARSKSHA
jgi:hypothetical protein